LVVILIANSVNVQLGQLHPCEMHQRWWW
jgi:hypothetical protein